MVTLHIPNVNSKVFVLLLFEGSSKRCLKKTFSENFQLISIVKTNFPNRCNTIDLVRIVINGMFIQTLEMLINAKS